MKSVLAIGAAVLSVIISADSCDPGAARPVTAVEQQRREAARQAATEQTYCYECTNIVHRRTLFGKPGVIGYVVLLNQAGQPVQYLAVNGKCTSSGKRLENAYEKIYHDGGEFNAEDLVPGPSEDGTYGSSDNYIYCFTTDGRYVQWSGEYLYSDKPFDLTIRPLVIDTSAKEQAQ